MNLKVLFQASFNSRRKAALIILLAFLLLLFSCASRDAARAEEYFSLGMAYFDMGKYSEAELWLNRAKAVNKAMTASEYNLGRIAFETGRYEEAALYFESILSRDPNNVMALKSAAYSRIKNGDLEKAESLYNRVLELVPESADDGFNYALVLYSLSKYEKCEEVLNKYPFALEENPSSVLLMARTQRAQNKIEAADSYEKWLAIGTATPQGLYEYAQILESAGLYAKALEQYRAAIDSLAQDTNELQKSKLLFEEARLLLIADPENSEGITGLNTAVTEGFSDTDAIEDLLLDERITAAGKEEIRNILNSILNKEEVKAEEEGEEEGNSS